MLLIVFLVEGAVRGSLTQLLQQVFICDQHLGLVQQQDYLDQDVVDCAEGYLLVVFAGYGVEGYVQKTVDPLGIGQHKGLI